MPNAMFFTGFFSVSRLLVIPFIFGNCRIIKCLQNSNPMSYFDVFFSWQISAKILSNGMLFHHCDSKNAGAGTALRGRLYDILHYV